MMVQSYQQQQELLRSKPVSPEIARVAGVYTDGISLLFSGDTKGSEKHYAYNAAVSFKSGDTVHLTRICGTYIVEYPIKGGS